MSLRYLINCETTRRDLELLDKLHCVIKSNIASCVFLCKHNIIDYLFFSVTYVYYEQYLTIVNEGVFNIAMCLLPTFIVCCILLGMDLRSGFLNLLTIVMITVDTVGVMTLWGIDFNAVSLINLVTVRFKQLLQICVCVCR